MRRNKRHLLLWLLVLSLVLSACGAGEEKAQEGEEVQVANPFEDCVDLKEAADKVGFELKTGTAPETVQVMDGKLIQAIYPDGMYIRKAASREDISGDSTEYPNVKQVDLEGRDVTLKGPEDGYVLAIWQADGYSYSVHLQKPVEEEVLTGIVAGVQ